MGVDIWQNMEPYISHINLEEKTTNVPYDLWHFITYRRLKKKSKSWIAGNERKKHKGTIKIYQSAKMEQTEVEKAWRTHMHFNLRKDM